MASNSLGEFLKIKLEYTQDTEAEKIVYRSWELTYFVREKSPSALLQIAIASNTEGLKLAKPIV